MLPPGLPVTVTSAGATRKWAQMPVPGTLTPAAGRRARLVWMWLPRATCASLSQTGLRLGCPCAPDGITGMRSRCPPWPVAAVMCAGRAGSDGLATVGVKPTGSRGALGSQGTRLPQNRALCRDVRVPQWVTAQNQAAPGRDAVRGAPPGGAPGPRGRRRESGSPAMHPIQVGQPGL